MDLSKARVAVTGAGGFIGRAPCAAVRAGDVAMVATGRDPAAALAAGTGRTRTWAAAAGLRG